MAIKDMSVVVRVLCVVMCVCGVNAYSKLGLLLWLILIKNQGPDKKHGSS